MAFLFASKQLLIERGICDDYYQQFVSVGRN